MKMQKLAHTAAIILTGGKSSRMGEDKAKLSWFNMSLLDYQCLKLREIISDSHIFISGPHTTPLISNPSILDKTQYIGPLEGMRCSLEMMINKTHIKNLLFLPVDMPLISAREIYKLCSLFPEELEAQYFKSSIQPILLKNSTYILNILNELCSEETNFKNRSIKNLVNQLKSREIETNLHELINMNTKEEWNDAISKTNDFATSKN